MSIHFPFGLIFFWRFSNLNSYLNPQIRESQPYWVSYTEFGIDCHLAIDLFLVCFSVNVSLLYCKICTRLIILTIWNCIVPWPPVHSSSYVTFPLSISGTFSSYHTNTLYSVYYNSPFHHRPASGNPLLSVCMYLSSKPPTEGGLHNMCSFVSGLIHLI